MCLDYGLDVVIEMNLSGLNEFRPTDRLFGLRKIRFPKTLKAGCHFTSS